MTKFKWKKVIEQKKDYSHTSCTSADRDKNPQSFKIDCRGSLVHKKPSVYILWKTLSKNDSVLCSNGAKHNLRITTKLALTKNTCKIHKYRAKVVRISVFTRYSVSICSGKS